MVVLDPDHRVGSKLFHNRLGESHISLTVRQPILLLEVHLTRVVVEKWPEDRIGEAVVMAVGDLVVKVHSLA